MTQVFSDDQNQYDGSYHNFQAPQHLGRQPLSVNTLFHSHNCLPRPYPEQHSIDNSVSSLELNSRTDPIISSPSLPTSQMDWSSHQDGGEFHYPNHGRYYNLFMTGGMSSEQSIPGYGLEDNSSCPRTWLPYFDSSVAESIERETSAPSQYVLEQLSETCLDFGSGGTFHNYVSVNDSRNFLRLSISRSPDIDNQVTHVNAVALNYDPKESDLLSSHASEYGEDDLGSGVPLVAEEHRVDEPYAKLIYRALLSAPNHSMVLQDIYQWFKENTDKGSSTSSGWRNSIRHNLSMNAAFRKTNRNTSEDDTKKISEWVLEPSAIQYGVTPTTRYRTKINKKVKSEHPAKARVDAGRKGGLSTGKSKSTKQRLWDEQLESMQAVCKENRRSQSQSYAKNRMRSRNISPSTPTCVEIPTSDPYYAKPDLFDTTLSLDDTKGVYPFNDCVVFCPEDQSQYSGTQPQMWQDFQSQR